MRILKGLLFTATAYGLPMAITRPTISSIALWLALLGTWTLYLSQPDISRSDARRHSRTDGGSVLVILLAALFAIALPVVEWGWKGHAARPGLSVTQGLGLGIVAAGLCLRAWAIRVLGRHFTASVRILENHLLVVAGPYTLVRHPSYLGALMVLCGHALLLHATMSAPVVAIIMTAAYVFRITHEERALVDQFGAVYHEYKANTAGLIPLVW